MLFRKGIIIKMFAGTMYSTFMDIKYNYPN